MLSEIILGQENMIDIKKIIEGAKTICITGHERPDGDCIGSTLGLYNYIKKIVSDSVTVDIYLEKLGPRYSYLKSFECVNSDYPEKEPYDVFFGLDCSTTDRYGQAQKYYFNAKKTVCIDHHISNEGFGNERYIVGDASSASELVVDLIPEDELDEDIAICLYSGIISDTGVLKYSCTSPKTLHIAAKLISFGFDFSRIIDESFYEKTYTQNQLLGRALMESVRFLEGNAIFTVVSKKVMEFYEATPKDLDGIVNQLLLTRGVHCAVFLHETGHHEYKVSMRSDEYVDVSKIAVIFGGGGHVRAAGCTVKGTMYDVLNGISKYLEESFIEKGLIAGK